MSEACADEVLDYWFGCQEDGFADAKHRALWFNGGAAADTEIRERFHDLIGAAGSGQLDDWQQSPRTLLAFVLVCDQFPRNVFRGTEAAFATDHLALRAAKKAITQRFDVRLSFDERAFLYLPFEHSEALIDQHTSVGLFVQLRDATPKGARHHTGGYLRHAEQHRDIILKFGRFPHRNSILGRTSSEEEAEFVAGGGGFGQQKT